jgi:hypothetical protein
VDRNGGSEWAIFFLSTRKKDLKEAIGYVKNLLGRGEIDKDIQDISKKLQKEIDEEMNPIVSPNDHEGKERLLNQYIKEHKEELNHYRLKPVGWLTDYKSLTTLKRYWKCFETEKLLNDC